MAQPILAALAIGAAAVAPAGNAMEHRVSVDHHRGAIDARYTHSVDVTHRQIGSVAPGGRASTLRCVWQANVVVDRQARHALGTLSRSIATGAVLEGSRPGWCAGQRRAIAREVAARSDELHRHMLAVAQADRAELLAEADRLHGAARAG